MLVPVLLPMPPIATTLWVAEIWYGFSCCVAYLWRFPLDKLKIDISFTRDLLTDPSCSAIAKTIIDLSQALGMEVIAEGVELREQQVRLLELGCRQYQGFLFSRALPIGEFEKKILARRN